ncbi:zinc-binding dehydrogenase [Streptomyces murinus]|uniref:zinc-binding dehydrogenase n=2 Tax=Streptomyces TaxID=1883 RepID=UPI002872E97D|nr:zinc-binding dehydrogenase [Streptomyces murinus]
MCQVVPSEGPRIRTGASSGPSRRYCRVFGGVSLTHPTLSRLTTAPMRGLLTVLVRPGGRPPGRVAFEANCRRPEERSTGLRPHSAANDASLSSRSEGTLLPIPDELPFDQAAIIPDAVSTPYAAIVGTGAVRPAQSVGIWGAGGLGAHAVRLARMVGAAPIIAIDPLPSARERALLFGADAALDPLAPGFAEAVREATAGRGLDVAFDFAGVGAARAQAASVLGPFGSLVLAGLTPEPVTIADSIGFCFNVNQVRGHYGSEPEHVEQLVGLASAGRIALAPSITAHVPLAEAADAVARLEKKVGDPIRLVLTP